MTFVAAMTDMVLWEYGCQYEISITTQSFKTSNLYKDIYTCNYNNSHKTFHHFIETQT